MLVLDPPLASEIPILAIRKEAASPGEVGRFPHRFGEWQVLVASDRIPIRESLKRPDLGGGPPGFVDLRAKRLLLLRTH